MVNHFKIKRINIKNADQMGYKILCSWSKLDIYLFFQFPKKRFREIRWKEKIYASIVKKISKKGQRLDNLQKFN